MASDSDDFTSFTGNLEDRTSWDLNTGSTGDITGVSNEAQLTGNIGTTSYNWTTAFDTNKVSVSCTVDPSTATTDFTGCGPFVISTTGEMTGYYLRATYSGTTKTHNLEVVDAGSFQAGANDTTDWVSDEKLTITVEDIGGGNVEVRGYIDDVEMANSPVASGSTTAVGGSTWYAGVVGYQFDVTQLTTLDNFEWEDVGGGTIAPQASHNRQQQVNA